MSNETKAENNSDRYAIEQAIARLDAEKDRVDAFMIHVKWIVSVVSSIVIVVVGFVSFLGISNLSDISKQVAEDARSRVRQAIQYDEANINDLRKLNEQLRKAQRDYEVNRQAIDALTVLQELSNVDRQDPFFAFQRLEKLEGEDSTAENRGTALKLMAKLIEAGERAIADPNTLFNASVVASKLDFQLEHVKLAVLAEHWRPSISHKALKAQATEVLGQDFTLIDGSLKQTISTPDQVRSSAWNDLLEMVREAPRVEGEQIYSRASNVALRNRSFGHYDDLILAIKDSEKRMPNQLTSYAYATLAQIYAWRGAPNWKENYWTAVRKSMRTLKHESPSTSWYDHAAESLLKNAYRVDLAPDFFELASKEGLSLTVWKRALSSDTEE